MSSERTVVSEGGGIGEREWNAPPGRGGRWREKPLTGAHVAGDMLGPCKGGLADGTLWGTVRRAADTGSRRAGRTLWSPAMVLRAGRATGTARGQLVEES